MSICCCHKNTLPPNYNEDPKSNWVHVHVEKTVPGKDEKIKHHYILDRVSGNLYLPESPQVIAEKQSMLLIGIPIYAAGNMCINLARIPATALKILYDSKQIYQEKGIVESFKRTCVDLTRKMPWVMVDNLWSVLTAPVYAGSMIFAAIHGICIDPNEGRYLIGEIEDKWRRQVGYRQDVRYAKIENPQDEMREVIKRIQDGKTFHLAYCMQPLGNLYKDPNGCSFEIIEAVS